MTSLIYSERVKAEYYYVLVGPPIRIAQELQRAPSTINCELAWCSPYTADAAQTDVAGCRHHCGRKTILTVVLKTSILNHLRLSWSPETIA